MKTNFPIACSLNGSDLAERRKDVLQKAGKSLIGTRELKNGFAYRFPVEDSTLENLFEIIKLERKCCPFLSFKLILESQNEFVSLEMTGKKGAKEAIKSLFEWN